jgi:L-seryl-tRNA(Ser) seleniumtransferase
LKTYLLAVKSANLSADAILARLRRNEPPIIARIEKGEVLLDLRTVMDDEEEPVFAALSGIDGGAGEDVSELRSNI